MVCGTGRVGPDLFHAISCYPMSFFDNRRAQRIAYSLGELIHKLAAGLENHGLPYPESLLRGLGRLISEETINGQRVIKLLIPITTKEMFLVSLATAPNSSYRLTIDGQGVYAGFSLACALPPQTVMLVLKPGALGKVMPQARLLYAACKTNPNAVEERSRQPRG
jgi:hypothetical protein